MSLQERINADFIKAYKEKREDDKKIFTVLRSSINAAVKENGDKELSDGQVVKVVRKQLHQAESLRQTLYDNGMSDDDVGVRSVSSEIEFLNSYLPKQLDPDQLVEIIHSIKEAGSDKLNQMQPGAKMGFIIKELKSGYEGQYDPKKVASLVKRVLGNE